MEKRKCLNCKDSREYTIEDRKYLYCERQGAFKTLWDRCDLKEITKPC